MMKEPSDSVALAEKIVYIELYVLLHLFDFTIQVKLGRSPITWLGCFEGVLVDV